ncbi:MAG: RlpA-like double-psi beta-barrel domain-containing protein [Hyphomicrobium sp.]
MSGAARRLASAAVAVAALAAISGADAKTPGSVYCFGGWCHRVSTVDEMSMMVGRRGTLKASFYDHCTRDRFNPCGLTSSGEVFRPDLADNAASPIFPDGTVLLAFNPSTNRAAVLRVNSAGPYRGDRTLDVSRAAADKLGFIKQGVAELVVTVIRSPEDSDARYQRRRKYNPVPGYLGEFRTFDEAHDAAIARLELEFHPMSASVASAGPELPMTLPTTPPAAQPAEPTTTPVDVPEQPGSATPSQAPTLPPAEAMPTETMPTDTMPVGAPQPGPTAPPNAGDATAPVHPPLTPATRDQIDTLWPRGLAIDVADRRPAALETSDTRDVLPSLMPDELGPGHGARAPEATVTAVEMEASDIARAEPTGDRGDRPSDIALTPASPPMDPAAAARDAGVAPSAGPLGSLETLWARATRQAKPRAPVIVLPSITLDDIDDASWWRRHWSTMVEEARRAGQARRTDRAIGSTKPRSSVKAPQHSSG